MRWLVFVLVVVLFLPTAADAARKKKNPAPAVVDNQWYAYPYNAIVSTSYGYESTAECRKFESPADAITSLEKKRWQYEVVEQYAVNGIPYVVDIAYNEFRDVWQPRVWRLVRGLAFCKSLRDAHESGELDKAALDRYR